MDAEQLRALIDAMTNMTTAIHTQRNLQMPSANVNIISNFDPFEPNNENFKNYKERLQNHFEIKNIANDKPLCAKLILQYIGSKNYALLTTLAAPKSINALQYEEIIELLENHFCPKKNVLAEQHKFFCEIQNETQTVQEFIAQLQKLAVDCNFVCKCKASVSEIFLRTQFIRGLRNENMREQLLQNPEESLQKILEKAIALEAAKMSNKQISNTTTSSTEVNQVKQFNNRNKKKLNYQQLGIEGMCLRCGRNNHLSNECKANKNNLKCEACNKKGHVKKVCIKSKINFKSTKPISRNYTNALEADIDEDCYGVNKVIDIYNKAVLPALDVRKFYTNVLIEGQNQCFEVDSGAGYTLLPENEFQKLNINTPMQKSNIIFRAYTGDIFSPLGMLNVNVKYKNQTSKEQLYIVPSKHTPLLGRAWIRRLKINLHEIDQADQNTIHNISNNHASSSIENILKTFANIFEQKVGCIPNISCALKLKPNAKPVFVKERQVPYALRTKVEEELDNLEKQGIIEKVNTSDWGSPLVVIPKPDGSVRLCVDYKIAVNPQLEAAHYPIKRIDEILNNLKDARFFCKLDIHKAYLHVQVDEDSQQIQTISTHRGTYRMKRLSFGIKTAPSEFNRIIDQILNGLEGTISYFDDILVFGENLAECENRLIKCLKRIEENNLHLNKNKCEYFKEEIQYLGYIVKQNRISKCPTKVEAIINMPQPKNSDDVRRFLGMITYYSRFIPEASTISFPLRQLLEKGKKFIWSENCQAAFQQLKNELVNDRVLVPFDNSLPIVLACDASPHGVAAVLSHIINGEERPVAFISRALTKAEQNYSQLDREALAIIFAIDKFYMYLYANEFTLLSDNKPLTRIFHQNAKTPAMTSARLLRYASFLQGFNYNIKHRKAEDNINADCLSRAATGNFHQKLTSTIDKEINTIQDQIINQISTNSITASSIAAETEQDTELANLKKKLTNGQTDSTEFSIRNGIILKNERVYIPASLRKEVLVELHHTHVGIVKMKQLARRYCYWKNIDADIENMVKSCDSCALVKKNPAKVIVHQWDEPKENFERIHIDYAGPFQNHHFLVVVDAKSKWPEIRIIKDAPTSEKTIDLLNNIFATHGLPAIIVSDNATIFQSNIFKEFCNKNAIIQKFIAPGHPATNGLAERHIQTLKYKLKAMENQQMPLQKKVQEILLRYRATPLSNNKSPAQQYLGRNLRLKLDAMRPTEERVHSEITEKTAVRNLSVGDRVQARWLEKNVPTWKFGVIIRKFGKLHYEVKLDSGYTLKRHINQLYKSNVAKQKVKEVQPQGNQRRKPEIEEIQISFGNNNNNNNNNSSNSNNNSSNSNNSSHNNMPPNRPTQVRSENITPTPIRRSERQKRRPAYLNDHVQDRPSKRQAIREQVYF